MTRATTHGEIVVGVDGSPSSNTAVQWAARDAALRGAPLRLAHVLMPPAAMARSEVPLPPAFQHWQETHGHEIINDAIVIAEKATVADPVRIDTTMVTGVPIACLAELSAAAQMVVVGRHGRGRLQHVLGSVSGGLVRHAHCPVAVVHDDDPLMPDAAFAPVVVGIDGSPVSGVATAVAFDEAARRGVDLVAVHACLDRRGLGDPDVDWAAVEPMVQKSLASQLAPWRRRHPSVAVRQVVVAGNAAERLAQESKHAQLVVVGSHGRGGFTGMLLGSVSSAVLQAARAPVIVARGA